MIKRAICKAKRIDSSDIQKEKGQSLDVTSPFESRRCANDPPSSRDKRHEFKAFDDPHKE